jgi:hypothetical protein
VVRGLVDRNASVLVQRNAVMSGGALLITDGAQPPCAFPDARFLKCPSVHREVKIFYANALLCPGAKHAKFLQRLHRMMFCPHGGFVRG